MIISFKNKDTENLFNLKRVKRFSAIERPALRALKFLHSVREVEEIAKIPGFKLHKLQGNRKGSWAMRVNQQYRIVFKFDKGDAFEVELTDYH